MMLRILLVAACVALGQNLQAQVTVDEFLNSVWEDPEMKSIATQQRYLYSKPYRLAPIQKMEFRTESNQLDPTRQEYAIRMNPANPWEMKYTSQYFKTYQELLQLELSRNLKDLLMMRYQVVVGWVYYEELKRLRENDKKTTQALLSILEAQRASSSFKAEDYLDLRLDLIDKVIELESTQYEIDNQRRIVDALYEKARLKSIHWPASSLISIENIRHVVDSLWQLENGSGEVAFREKRVELATRAFQLEKSNINMGFVQARYQEYRLEQDRRPWSLSMGVTIPIFNPNKGDMTRRQLNTLEAQSDLDKAKLEQQNGKLMMREKVMTLISRYNEIGAITDSLKIDDLMSTVQVIKNSDPSVSIRVQRNLNKVDVLKARLKRDILLAYLEFLSYAEVLQQQPLVNYLSSGLNSVR